MESEEQLLKSLTQGVPSARRRLYDHYAGCLMAVCMRYLSDRYLAQDVLHDSFVKILTSIGRFEYRGEGSLKAWMMRIAANESLTVLRRNGRFETVDNIPEETDEEPDIDQVPMNEMMRMIGELPTGYRTVFNMFVFEERSHKSIALELGIKEDSSASQFLRAKKILAKKIKEYKHQQGMT
ncbi:MAG: RNA polymerase sigma factor [Prevotella sp.]|nr:RNA polymerase sigma factor [Prevotella sp.]